MKKVIISQPINDVSKQEILENRRKAEEYLKSQGYEVINSYSDMSEQEKNCKNPNLLYIGKTIQAMSQCDNIYFVEGWPTARNCRVERLAAILYNIEILAGEEDAESNNTNS